MNVKPRDDIKPLCDRHFSRMELARFGAGDLELAFAGAFTSGAYICKDPGCARAYESALGYRDMNTGISFADQVRRQCPDDQTSMFVSGINRDSDEQTWTCAQVHCDHSEIVPPAKRTA